MIYYDMPNLFSFLLVRLIFLICFAWIELDQVLGLRLNCESYLFSSFSFAFSAVHHL